ncbi:MAG TPA: CHAT domain-containing protein [Gemmataceae bacterium]|nr:CHAT domain-containing protein [Gemmataceae bacterium]
MSHALRAGALAGCLALAAGAFAADPPKQPKDLYHRTVCGIEIGKGVHRIDREKQKGKLTDAQSDLVEELRVQGRRFTRLRDRANSGRPSSPWRTSSPSWRSCTAGLVEELAVGTVTSGRQALEMFTAKPSRAPAGMLALGGIDCESGPKKPVPDKAGPAFPPLPGTLLEAQAVAGLYRKAFPDARADVLSGADATKARLKRDLARGPRVVHVAGHGFFAPPTTVSALRAGGTGDGLPAGAPANFSPLLLSGLVMAGGARAPAAADDSILTAEEVTSLDLRGCELVVLSACETGLGEAAGGEGVLGLQRAFHAAGARTLVTSLWKVDDAATSVLMEEFYTNLWRKKLSKLEALRQAQLSVLKEPKRVEKRRKELGDELSRRGLKLGVAKPVARGEKGRSHPALWAAFLLSGEPR